MPNILTPQKLLEYGYPVIPSGGGQLGKSPLVLWTEFQTRYPDESELQKWANELHPSLWGIVTGAMSGVVIIDIDDPKKKVIFDQAGLFPMIQTPRGGFHYWFRHPGTPVKTCTGILPGIDIRGDGGFVNVIGKRKDGEYIILDTPTPEAIYSWDRLPPDIASAIKSSNNGHKSYLPPQNIEAPIPEGQRNDTLTRIGGALRRQGLDESTIFYALKNINDTRCSPPLPEKEVAQISKSVARYFFNGNVFSVPPTHSIPPIAPPSSPEISENATSERYKSVTKSVTENGSVTETLRKALQENCNVTQELVEGWVRETNAWFSYEEMDKELGIHSEGSKRNRRAIIKRLKDEGIIEAHPRENKLYRFINTSVRLIDFRNASNKTPINIYYPFGIEGLISTYPGNLVVIAGAPNAGKTAFLLNFVHRNMGEFPIYYQSSEMGESELAVRLEKFEGISLNDWNFTAEERSTDFHDVIRPDCINIIDYMEITDEFYKMGGFLSKIHEKLSTGIAIVAIQKNPGVDLGRGGNLGTEKPRLYLSMDAGKIKIVKGKNWANPEINPNRLVRNFKIAAGCRFHYEDEWHLEESI